MVLLKKLCSKSKKEDIPEVHAKYVFFKIVWNAKITIQIKYVFSAHPLNFSSVLTFDGHLQAANKGLNLIRGFIAPRRHYY